MENKKFIICSCSSLEHQIMFWKDENELYIEIHLSNRDNFFKRLWYGLKYAFGYKCRYGNWDEFLFDDINQKELYNYLKSQYE